MTDCFYAIWEKQGQIWTKIVCIPKSMHLCFCITKQLALQ